jgi:hypothetical protein
LPSRLEGVTSVLLGISQKDRGPLGYNYTPRRMKGYFPLGTYGARGIRINNMGNKETACEFEPIQVTQNSPVRLVFRVRKPEVEEKILYSGQVVNAVTGKPMEEASVRIRRQTVKTDSNGRFEIRFRPNSQRHDELTAFKEDYFSAQISIGDLPRAKSGRVEVQPMLLFPAAKLKIVPCIAGDAPAGYRVVAAAERIRPWVVIGHNESPIWSSTFSAMCRGLSGRGRIPPQRLKMNHEHTFPVPAGVDFRLRLTTRYESLCPPYIPQTINLKQGELLNLGRCVFEPAIQIFLKVVDSVGEPMSSIAIAKRPNDPYNTRGSLLGVKFHRTSKSGRVAFYVRPNSQAKFDIYRDVRTSDVIKTVTFKMGGREDEGKEFVVQL